jgi:hypothetical protein
MSRNNLVAIVRSFGKLQKEAAGLAEQAAEKLREWPRLHAS